MGELAILIINWNGHDDTIECLNSITKNERIPYKIFLLDNNSKFESINYIEKWLKNESETDYKILTMEEFTEYKKVYQEDLYYIKSNINLGFAKGNNVIWNVIKNEFEYVLLLNNDTVTNKNSISNMVKFMNMNREIGVLSCDIRNYYEKNSLWNAGGYFTIYGDRKYYGQELIDRYKKEKIISIETPFVTGCVMLIRKSVSNNIGTFTEKFFFGEEDYNYCKRLSYNNVRVVTYLDSTIYHKVGQSISKRQKDINSYILHFSNRIIDEKEFMKSYKWRFWRELYLAAIFIHALYYKKNLVKAKMVYKKIRYYTSKYNEISYDTFIEINSLEI